jgi:hypothetical protein
MTESGLKHCSSCRLLKPVWEFSRNRSRPDGLRSECKLCHRAAVAAYNRTETGKATQRRYNCSGKGRLSKQIRNDRWRETHPDYSSDYGHRYRRIKRRETLIAAGLVDPNAPRPQPNYKQGFILDDIKA